MSNYNNKQKNKNKNKKKAAILISAAAAVILIAAIIVIIAMNQTTTVYIDFTVDGEIIYSGNIDVKGIDPTVLDATVAFAKENKIPYTYDDEKNPTTLRDFGDYLENQDTEAGAWYFWEFGINDITVYDITGRASNNLVQNGDSIHWYFSSIPYGS